MLITPALDAQLSKAAQRNRVSKGEWVRRALQESLQRSKVGGGRTGSLARLESLKGPTGGIEKMLSEIQAGRS